MTLEERKSLIEFARRINLQYGNKFKDYNNLKNNNDKYNELINDPNIKTFKIDDKYLLFSKIEPNSHQHVDHFVDISSNRVIAITMYSIIENKKYVEEMMWRFNDNQYKGIITHLYINYYLENYKAIVSDDQLTEPAFKSWLRKVKEILNCGGNAAIVNPNFEKITTLTLNNYNDIMNKNYQIGDDDNEPTISFNSPAEDELNKMNRFDREEYELRKSINYYDYLKSNKNRFMIYK